MPPALTLVTSPVTAHEPNSILPAQPRLPAGPRAQVSCLMECSGRLAQEVPCKRSPHVYTDGLKSSSCLLSAFNDKIIFAPQMYLPLHLLRQDWSERPTQLRAGRPCLLFLWWHTLPVLHGGRRHCRPLPGRVCVGDGSALRVGVRRRGVV